MDDEHFLATVTPHIPAMLRVANALVGTVDAEDVVQEALTQAWRAWHTLRAAVAARAWLLRITINLAHNLHRSRIITTPPHVRSLDAEAASVRDVPALHPLEADPGNRAAILDLRAAVDALPPALRLVIALRYYAGLDATEIGRLLTTPPATIRTRLRRALTLLRATLGDATLPLPGEEAHV